MAKTDITFTLSLDPEDRARVDRIASALEALLSAPGRTQDVPAAPVDKSPVEPVKPAEARPDAAKSMEKVDTPADLPWSDPEPAPAPTPAPTPTPTPAAPLPTLGDLQSLVVKLSAAGKKDQVREIIKSYAEKVSAIEQDKYPEVIGRLEALK